MPEVHASHDIIQPSEPDTIILVPVVLISRK